MGLKQKNCANKPMHFSHNPEKHSFYKNWMCSNFIVFLALSVLLKLQSCSFKYLLQKHQLFLWKNISTPEVLQVFWKRLREHLSWSVLQYSCLSNNATSLHENSNNAEEIFQWSCRTTSTTSLTYCKMP